MIIDNISLHNYGVYKDKQIFDLQPKKNKPIIVTKVPLFFPFLNLN